MPPTILSSRAETKIEVVALWQAREVIKRHGLFADVETYANTHIDDLPALYQLWNFGNNVVRHSPIIDTMKVLLNLTDAGIDAMFDEASRLRQ